MIRKYFFILLTLAIPTLLKGEDKKLAEDPNFIKTKQEYKQNLIKFKENNNVFVALGVLANKEKQNVVISAETTGLKKDEIIEYALIYYTSGHDYESIATTFAKPSDIIKAIKFLGIKQGLPVNYKKSRIFPKGERMNIFINVDNKDIPISDLVFDTTKNNTLPNTGFTFTSSYKAKDTNGNEFVVADKYEPNSIISLYNEPQTVFDIPYIAIQDDMYGNLTTQRELPKHKLTHITIKPILPPGESRIMDLTLVLSGKKAKTNAVLNDSDNKLLAKGLNDIAAFLLSQKDKDIFLELDISKKLYVSKIINVFRNLNKEDTNDIIKHNPPNKNHLFEKAYTPPMTFLNRKAQRIHPWELRITKNDDKLSAILIEVSTSYGKDISEKKIITKDFTIHNTQELLKTIQRENNFRKDNDKAPIIPVILVIISENVTHGELMSFLSSVVAKNFTIYIYNESQVKDYNQ